MKRIFIVLLLIVLGLGLSSCGSKKENKNTTTNKVSTSTEKKRTTSVINKGSVKGAGLTKVQVEIQRKIKVGTGNIEQDKKTIEKLLK